MGSKNILSFKHIAGTSSSYSATMIVIKKIPLEKITSVSEVDSLTAI